MRMGTTSRATKSPALGFAIETTKELRRAAQTLATNSRNAKATGNAAVEPFLTTLPQLLSDVEHRLAELDKGGCARGSKDEEAVCKLLDVLERLVKGPPLSTASAKAPWSNRYPGLTRLSQGNPQSAKANISKVAKDKSERATNDKIKYRTSFKNFAKAEKGPRGLPLSDLVVQDAKPKEDQTVGLQSLYSTLYKATIQEGCCRGSFVANLALGKVEKLDEEKDEVPFKLFFLHHHPTPPAEACWWKEVRIRVFAQNDSSGTPSVHWSRGKETSPAEFCQFLRLRSHGRLIFSATDSVLLYDNADIPFLQLEKTLLLLGSSSISLATVLEKRKLHGNDQLKVLLSYLLAKSVWQFYDSNWMSDDWSKHTIHFMRERLNATPEPQDILTLIHKPFLATQLRSIELKSEFNGQANKTGTEDDFATKFAIKTHCYPKILALGIMLLEIELGQGIERQRSDTSPSEPSMQNEDHFTAGVTISSDAWKTRKAYQAIKEIIEICVKPDTGRLGTNPADIRKNLFTYVVSPLGRLFRRAWSLEEDPEAFCPDPVSFKSTDLGLGNLQPTQLEAVDEVLVSARQPLSVPLSRAFPQNYITTKLPHQETSYWTENDLSDEDDGQLADDDEDNQMTRRTQTDKWFFRFQLLLTKFGIGRGAQERLAIAILDSGIDYKHADFNAEDRGRIKEMKTFIGGNKDDDLDGHGTHIAAIILRLTKNVDLYIGKITNSHIPSQREKIAEAIRHAREEWKVDMISLSFGFQDMDEMNAMGKEINQCLNSGIMVFASASNDGGEGGRTYPAKCDQRVICAHSTTFRGSKSDSNPDPEGPDNFSFVGQLVRPIWPAKVSKDANGMKYKSGTSYATPVAVAVAAFMIGYIQKTIPDQKWITKPRSPEGILRIFRLMAKKRDGYDWVSPTRYFKRTIPEKIVADIKQSLGY